MCRVSSTQTLQPTWLKPPSHTSKQTHSHTHNTLKDRLYEEVKERSHPAGCSLSVLLSMLSRTLPAFEAACRYDIFTNIPRSFHRTFACPGRLLSASLGSPPSLVLYVSDTLQSFWRKFGGNEQHIFFPCKKIK